MSARRSSPRHFRRPRAMGRTMCAGRPQAPSLRRLLASSRGVVADLAQLGRRAQCCVLLYVLAGASVTRTVGTVSVNSRPCEAVQARSAYAPTMCWVARRTDFSRDGVCAVRQLVCLWPGQSCLWRCSLCSRRQSWASFCGSLSRDASEATKQGARL